MTKTKTSKRNTLSLTKALHQTQCRNTSVKIVLGLKLEVNSQINNPISNPISNPKYVRTKIVNMTFNHGIAHPWKLDRFHLQKNKPRFNRDKPCKLISN